MRIAICLSGQPRTWKRCYKSWFNAISHLGEVDVFYHLWNYNTLPNSAAGFMQCELPNVEITKEEECEIYDILQPKACQVESIRTFPVFNSTNSKVENPIAWWTRNQFYGLKKCAFIKREYEIRNNFEYNIVFRFRTDIELNYRVPENFVPKPNTMYTCVNLHDPKYNTYRVGDIFYYADSYTYDQMSNFYDAFNYIDALHVVPNYSDYPPELAFYYYMKSMGINNVSVTAHSKIIRTEEYKTLKGGLEDYESL